MGSCLCHNKGSCGELWREARWGREVRKGGTEKGREGGREEGGQKERKKEGGGR